MKEIEVVTDSLRKLFKTASDIYVDTETRECELKVSPEDFQGEITERLFENGIRFEMVDMWDIYPYKYIFEYFPLKKTFD